MHTVTKRLNDIKGLKEQAKLLIARYKRTQRKPFLNIYTQQWNLNQLLEKGHGIMLVRSMKYLITVKGKCVTILRRSTESKTMSNKPSDISWYDQMLSIESHSYCFSKESLH